MALEACCKINTWPTCRVAGDANDVQAERMTLAQHVTSLARNHGQCDLMWKVMDAALSHSMIPTAPDLSEDLVVAVNQSWSDLQRCKQWVLRHMAELVRTACGSDTAERCVVWCISGHSSHRLPVAQRQVCEDAYLCKLINLLNLTLTTCACAVVIGITLYVAHSADQVTM